MSKLWVRRTLFSFFQITMATTTGKMQMLGTGRLTGKYIARPVIVRKRYEKVPEKSAVEYNLNRKEFSLFKGFKNQSGDIRLGELERKIALLKARTQSVWARRPCGQKSFAEVASIGARSVEGLSSTPEAPAVPLWSRYQARRDYTRAYKQQAAERLAAFELVKAMAARRPVFVSHQRETITLVKKQELREAIKRARKDRKILNRPTEVEAFSPLCYREESVVEPVKVHWPSPYKGVARPTSVKQKKIRAIITEPEVVWFSCQKEETPQKPQKWDKATKRQLFVALMERTQLGRALLAGILRVKAQRAGKVETCEEALRYFNEMTKIEPQMDPEGVVGKVATDVNKASNTLIDSIQPVDFGINHQVTQGFGSLSVSRENQSFTTMSNRWLIAKQVTWLTSHKVNDELLIGYYLPQDIVKDNPSAQNTQLFYTHRWFRGNMRVRFALNSNAFQVGMLVGSVLYTSKDETVGIWDNVYSALQRNHCKLNAGSGNDGEIVIPFKWYNSMMTYLTDTKMCKLSLRCLVPLTVTAGVATSCSVTIFVTFEDIEFYGMISRSLGIKPQMDSIANVMNAGSNLIATLRGDANRDNPPLPLQPVSLIPQAMTSLAYMDGQVEPVNVLRADSRGQTPHADISDEMNVYKLIKGWGFVQSFVWKSTQTQGTQVFKLQVVPLRALNEYPSVTNEPPGGMIPTPLAYISSMFGKFRGDIEYKFEIVASKFHVGRLIIGAIPLLNVSTCSLEDLRYSAYRIADVADTSEIVFRVPWHWYNSFASVRLVAQPKDVPSSLYVLVINPLIAIDSVPPEVTVNVYERAADNFELAIPRPSILDPRLSDTLVPPKNQYLKPYNLENAWYTTWERNLTRTDGLYLTTIYIQNISDGWVGYTNTELGKVYELQIKSTKGRSFRCYKVDRTTKSNAVVRYGVADPDLRNSNAQGLVVFAALKVAQDFATNLSRGKPQEARDKVPESECWYSDGPWSEVLINGVWVTATNDNDPPIWVEQNVTIEDYEVIQPQMDDRVSVPVTSIDIPSSTSSMGFTVFGEKTPDLKSLCRRYNHLGSIKATTHMDLFPRDVPYAARIRINPIRHVQPLNSASYDNRFRHGIITQVGSLYRLWRGGLRYRFVVVGSPPEGTTLYVQHRFDKFGKMKQPVELGPQKVSSRDDMMNTQYATFAQVLSVNTSFVVEVPYYQENEALSTLPDGNFENKDNGALYLWFHSKSIQDVHIEVFYSFADDTRFSVFQGVPQCMDLNMIVPEPQMDSKPSTSNGVVYNKASETVESQGVLSSIMDTLRAPKKIADQTVSVAEDVKETKEYLKSTLSSLKGLSDSLKSKISSTTDKIKTGVVKQGVSSIFDLICDAKDKLFSVFTHLIYVILSPTVKTIGWALMNLYHAIFGFTMEGIHIVTTFVQEMWEKCKTSRSTKQPQRKQIKPQDDSSSIGSYAGLLFTGLATMCKVTAKPPTSLSSAADGLFAFANSARAGSFVSKFFEDNMELLKRVWFRFVAIFGIEDTENLNLISGTHDKRLKNWLLESSVVTASHNLNRVLSEPEWSQKVFELAIVGRSLQIVMVNSPHAISRVTTMVNDYMKLLKVLEKRLIDSKIYSGVRYEPWCLWVAGRAGTGKTRYLQVIADELARLAGYSGQTSYHTMTAGQKYMDGFIGQPSILLDDFMTMSPSADPESYAQFLQMVSSALYNPPFAVAEEKNKLVNFNNLLVSANRLFFQNLAGISDVEAYNRRRKCLLEFDFIDSETTADNLEKRYTQEQLSKMEHIKVFVYHSPSDPQSTKEEISRIEGEDYNVTVNRVVLDRAKSYHQLEVTKYQKACERCLENIEQIPKAGTSLSDQIKATADSIEKFNKGIYFKVKDCFKNWIDNCTESSTFLTPLEVVEGQGDNPFEEVWPKTWKSIEGATDIDNWPASDVPIAPLSRSAVSAPQYNSDKCLHETFDYEYLNWDAQHSYYYSHRIADVNERMALSMPHGPCLRKTASGELVPSKKCIWESQKNKIFYKIFTNPMDEAENSRDLCYANSYDDWSSFNERYHEDVVQWIQKTFKKDTFVEQLKQVNAFINKVQTQKQSEFVQVESMRIPKKPIWKRIGQAVWDAFLRVIVTLTECILIATGLILSLIGISYVFSKFASGPSEEEDLDLEPNLHPSGDYKTVRNSRTVHTRAIKLMDGEGAELSTEEDVINDCSIKNNQSMGSLNKIIGNSFFLVGKVPVSDTTFMTYKARCLGIFNKKFIVIKHYIEHFRASGVEKVCVVFHGAKAMVEYNLDDFQFRWTKQGYGISELPPSSPKQFKNILKQIPSDKFDGNYPSQCVIVEPYVDEVIEHPVTIKRISNPKVVPATTTQSAWTIEQGFEYNWGGKGKCGSFVFAPSMACPLVGIHTAGIDTSKGFAEILLRETFYEEAHVIEYVTPQMNQDPNVYGLDGFYEQVGKLDADLVPPMPSKTKIEASEIQGVFPITTQPAPLSSHDDRLEEKGDILKIGVSKRCNPLREFPLECVNTAYMSICKLYKKVLKPVRAGIKPLSYIEACEGLSVEGYDPIEFRTSEGYPWSRMRPAGASDKSWMFQLTTYPDGRNKVEGFIPELLNTLEGKAVLRKNGIVPASYFTACLKDARIPNRKVSVPGNTRVFEMSPVDLTIAQRQFFMDFTVAYRAARLQAENSIGINPDGKEWTQLVEYLTEFSPCILTADYSGYGPRLSHALLERSFDASIVWLMDNEACEEEEMNDRCVTRLVLKHEVTHGLHVVKDLVFRPTCGLPSGNCETVERNSQTNSLYIRIAFYELAKRYAPVYRDAYWFDKKVRLVTNGDDLIASVKEDVISWFNNRTLIEFFAEYGLKMTDALKSGVVRDYCSIEEASYLKRGFVKHPTREGEWMAPLEEASITDTANWVWRSVDKRAASLVNSEACCRLAYTRGPEFYERIASQIQQRWSELGVQFEYPPWELLDNHVWEGTEGPKFSF